MTQPQRLALTPQSDGKMWVAELIGPDPTYRFQRIFLPEIEEGVFLIYDGIYQIYGCHPQVSPFNKEYCRVVNGHMERRLDPRRLQALLPEMVAREDQRRDRIKQMIRGKLEEVKTAFPHEQVNEAIDHQIDYLNEVEGSAALMQAYHQVNRQLPMMIADYQRQIQMMRGENEWL